ncbi:sigma-54-dependent Fis family transcriptional regulator [Syntrophomonas wolfei]|jgi:PAS domain S-box-containing protein/TyrR family helix-turn-helix protein|uniref:HTH-type transcriptional regulatory protein TyrR n=1 Tax=Syntrophomonas wolfei subsp. wolfei (strain DSM 2245B / Goettingen) TaxID=335541 RepID=Q0AWW3_SYNWW|nr:sigma-54-dependent Fis family transcriptional regulator [Syntrophomonas wolfei]ABI68791.1 sigma-L-dependent transcriptional regulator [Syntrophomonas wolfei subsp. wolfei str. Goettingen G311]
MNLGEIMSPNPVLLRPEQSIRETVTLFLERNIDGAPVVDENNQIIGLFTKTHVYRAIEQEMDMLQPIEKLMKRDIIIGHPEEEIEDVLYPGLGRLPIADETGIMGMITRTDLARVFLESYRNISSELDAIINSTHNMIVSVDKQSRIRVFNRAAEKLLKQKAENVKGKLIDDVYPTSRLTNIIKSGQVETLQKIMLNNHYFISNRSPIIKDGEIIGAVGVLQDISELEELSRELKYVKELNEELDAIIESSYDGLYITDGNGMTLRLNKAFEMITGINGREFLGRHVDDIAREGIVSESVSSLALARKETVTIIQETRSGKTTLATGSPVFDKIGNIFRVVCNVRDITELNMLKQKLEQVQGLSQHYESQLKTLRIYSGTDKIISKSTEMRKLLETVVRLAEVDSTILINGESGTGKELIAETIHNHSARAKKPFIKVNCGAIPENLMESELFGYEYGAFTGAKKEGKAGYFELAHEGTLFLDEIGDLPFNLQVKLLRVLQSKEINRVGGRQALKVDTRILAATNRNLLEMVQKKQFREDLYYRLHVIPVIIPPLRDRKEDIPSLIVHFIALFNRKYKLNKRISPDVVDILMAYDWPGNVRELENLIERLVVISSSDIISRDELPVHLSSAAVDNPQVSVSAIIPLKEAVESVERQLLERAFAQYRTTRQMAQKLEVNASTVVRKAAKYGISPPSR